jgi:hypothetical protein
VKRVLVVTKFLPTGHAFGGMTRTLRLLEALRERFEVEVVGFVEKGEPAIRGRLNSLVTGLATRRAYQMARYDTPWLRKEMAARMASFRPDALHIDYLQLADVAWDYELPRLLDLHNVESALAAAVASSSSGPSRFLAARDARLLKKVEVRAAAAFDAITVPSAKEARRMPGNVHVVPNGVDASRLPLDVTPEPAWPASWASSRGPRTSTGPSGSRARSCRSSPTTSACGSWAATRTRGCWPWPDHRSR